METLPRVFDRCCSVGGESGYGSQTDITSIFTNNAFTNSTVNVIGRNGSITNLNEVDQSEFDALRAGEVYNICTCSALNIYIYIFKNFDL